MNQKANSFPPVSFCAERKWRAILPDIQNKVLSCVWCTTCSKGQPITNWKLLERDEMVIIEGFCQKCSGECVRVLDED